MTGDEAVAHHVPPSTDVETAGTLDHHSDFISSDSTLSLPLRRSSTPDDMASTPAGDIEQALESHEVIELQAFGQRKEWIVEKTKFLESLPPIDLFVGLDAVRSSADVVPGLPTREQLRQWLDEHDKIEKDTEAFDSGELKKFKKFTKAAAKRNLSPEDTDLIEVTLTTIYEFDKLLHLLRDRSESLDLLGVRLTWEEQRAAAWADRRQLLSDLDHFLKNRARWSPAVYESMTRPEEPSHRRGSIMSVASDSSIGSSSLGFSRSLRFTLAESLSRDAAQVASRISSLRHGRISAAGKALDKLIDNSRNPVPEELLDEQDKLEDLGINEMENVGKFAMHVVTQWRKADEFYVETMKDQSAAQSLYEEIQSAKLSHPSIRLGSAFAMRANVIAKRLLARDSPISSSFPRPYHSLFPDQEASNDTICQLLDTELSAGIDLVRQVEKSAQEYQAAVEAVKRVEAMSSQANTLAQSYDSIISRLQHGVDATDGDGTPPDLTTPSCLRPAQHSTFIALLPSLFQELDKADIDASLLLPQARAALLALNQVSVDPDFKTQSTTVIEGLDGLKISAKKLREDMGSRVDLLRNLRRVWSSAESILRDLEGLRRDIGDTIERHKWTQETASSGLPMTPESSNTPLPNPTSPPDDMLQRLEALQARFSLEVQVVISTFPSSLHPGVHSYVVQRCDGLSNALGHAQQLIRLSERVQKQALVMAELRDESHGLQIRLEDVGDRFNMLTEGILTAPISEDADDSTELTLMSEASILESAVQKFVDSLSHRVPLVAPEFLKQKSSSHVRRRFWASSDLTMETLQEPITPEFPLDLAHLDGTVRADCNAFALNLNSDVESLLRKRAYLYLAHDARGVDSKLAMTLRSIQQATEQIETMRTSVRVASVSPDASDNLLRLKTEFSQSTDVCYSEISRSLSPVRQLLSKMELAVPPGDTLVSARSRALGNAEDKFQIWLRDAESVKTMLSEAYKAEEDRLEEERRQLAEKQRMEAEERARLEREQLEAQRREEERLRLAEKQRQESEERARLERERLEAQRLEEERLQRVERERKEEEELARLEKERKLEEERLEEEARQCLERERQEQERARLEQERKLEEERRQREEKERQDAEERARLVRQQEDILLAERAEEEERKAFLKRQQALDREPIPEQVEEGSSEDVFGFRLALAPAASTIPNELLDIHSQIQSLRKRLRLLNINAIVRPSKASTSSIPSHGQYAILASEFAGVAAESSGLPSSVPVQSLDAELRSLRREVADSEPLLQRIEALADLGKVVQDCDAALSDLLEHIDSYPAPPAGPLSSTHVTLTIIPPEEQLSARIVFTKNLIDELDARHSKVADDIRASSERKRVLQTWNELESMAFDRLHGRKSRPPSAISSGRSSRASIDIHRPTLQKKASTYSNLSVGSSSQGRGRMLAPAHPSTSSRRVVSNNERSGHTRPSSGLSVASTNRSVSGPLFSPSSRLFNTTFASRQRTTSLSSTTSPSSQTPSRRSLEPSRPRPSIRRMGSPTPSDASSQSRSFGPPRSTTSHSTWGRTPRLSFPSPAILSPPRHRTSPPKKRPYVANPKNRLDVAVGAVVNNLPVDIKIEVVEETWKDQSGKYWIGGEDPKLCFCRILRSHTVMVRVGGGWMELSNFIQTHFADMFRAMPDVTSSFGSKEEKWISSATLLEAPEIIGSPPRPPRTPERHSTPPIPSFALSTPSGRSPQSLKSTSSPGSPLTPLQFLRRAEVDGMGMRPVTPTKSSVLRSRNTVPLTPARTPAWKP
ncbi:hypothetical protein BV25DRAFT_1844712 [Artomyces pyxidatus]|uniref:Uncharacterized protein n=1 Tax=Artomyces pyxidatus TaxID=48021 RepID=A0ACB8TKD8_9AGAM|nr:hypothetical protein BV25DRAFT_1844712 [Artomyces pyxidatus]